MNQPYKMFKCNYSKKQDLTFQVISRKILNCLILYKKFANFFTLSSFVFDFKQWLNFYIIIDIKYIIYFLYSFIYHIFNYFSQSKSKLYLYNFCKIIEYYTDLIEYKSKFIENFGFYLPFRKKTFDEYFNIDLTYELSFFNFLKITYIQLFSKIKEYIIYRKNVYFDFFSVKKATKYEFLFGHDRLKPNINLKKIPFYFGIDLIKKFLIISIYVVHINLITKPSINYKKMFSLENFIDYTVIKLFKNMACNFQIIFCNFLVSENISFSSNKLIKKKLFIFLNMRYSVYFTLYQSFFEVKNFNLFLFFLASFEKKINTQIITKIHKNFLNLNAKMLLVFTHVKKLKYHLCNFSFLTCVKINLVFNKKIFIKIFLLKTRLISFIRIIEQLFAANSADINFELYGIANESVPGLFQKIYYTVKKMYRAIFLHNQKISTFIIFIKIISFAYFYKNFLFVLNNISYILNAKTVLCSTVHTITYHSQIILCHKINFYKSKFEELMTSLLLLVCFEANFSEFSTGLDFCNFFLKKNFF